MKIFTGVFAVLVILAILNPTKDDFDSYYKNLIKSNSPFSQKDFPSKVPVLEIMTYTTRTNYYIFSVFKTEIPEYSGYTYGDITKYGFVGTIIDEEIPDTTKYGMSIILIIIIIATILYFRNQYTKGYKSSEHSS